MYKTQTIMYDTQMLFRVLYESNRITNYKLLRKIVLRLLFLTDL